MDDRYEVFDTLGKGVFSTVLRARDTAHKNALGKHPEVAVKVGHNPNATIWQKCQCVLSSSSTILGRCADTSECHQSML